MAVDKRTFYIVAILVAIALPAIVLVFHKSFFPLLASIGRSIVSAALTGGTTGVPRQLMERFK